MHNYKQNGFTLIEIMLALFIFAILAMIAATGLFAVIKSRDITTKHVNRLLALQIANVIIQRDILQAIDRPITDKNGQPLPAFILKNNYMEFTRAGFTNPFGTYRRSNLQRVAYVYQGNDLIRETWLHLDRAPTAKPTKKVLLKNILKYKVILLGNDKKTYNSWPLPRTNNQYHPIPKGVEIFLTLKGLGTMNRVFAIRGIGFGNADLQ